MKKKSTRTRPARSSLPCLLCNQWASRIASAWHECEPFGQPAVPALRHLPPRLRRDVTLGTVQCTHYNWWRCGVLKNIYTLELRSRTLPPVMPDSPQPTSPPPSVACSGAVPQRHPAVFSGTDEQDVNDWLATYERVSLHNRWMIPPS